MIHVVVDTINGATVRIRHRDGRTSKLVITESASRVEFDITPADLEHTTVQLNGQPLRPPSPTLDAALAQFLAAWNDGWLAGQVGQLCTQTEIAPLVDLYEKAEMHAPAQMWSAAKESGHSSDDGETAGL